MVDGGGPALPLIAFLELGLRIEEHFDVSPVLSRNVVGADVPAALEGL